MMSEVVGSVSLIIPLISLMVESPPLLMTLLVGQSLLVVGFTGVLKSIWYSYILFMVFLGGILVIFAYVSSLVETRKMKLKMKVLGLLFISVLGVSGLLKLSSSSTMLKEFDNNSSSEEFVVYGLISMWSSWIYAYVVMYLLLALYCVCSLLKTSEGPLRGLNFSNS